MIGMAFPSFLVLLILSAPRVVTILWSPKPAANGSSDTDNFPE